VPIQRRRLSFHRPGSPRQNAWVESFNGRLPDELLKSRRLDSLQEARVTIKVWRCDYNANSPTPTTNSLQPSSRDSGPRATNPKAA
jgi:putative transposase